MRTNVLGVQRLFDACLKAGVGPPASWAGRRKPLSGSHCETCGRPPPNTDGPVPRFPGPVPKHRLSPGPRSKRRRLTAMGLRLSTVILPVDRWHAGGRSKWQTAEDLGFHAAYTYDHLSWRVPFRDGPWFGALPTLTAAAAATRRLGLGTLVTSVKPPSPITY